VLLAGSIGTVDDVTGSAAADRTVRPGVSIEVWCPSISSWSRGFVVHDLIEEGVIVQRRSDGVVLPAPFDPSRVRPAQPTLTRSRPARQKLARS